MERFPGGFGKECGMAGKRMLPMGIENFEEMRAMGYYYIDKTRMIKDLLENLCKVSLFTRPRRFGKTLNMSMLKYFFQPESDGSIFDGLEISKEKEICEKYMVTYRDLDSDMDNLWSLLFTTGYLTQAGEAEEQVALVIPNREIRWIFVEQIQRWFQEETAKDSQKLEAFCKAFEENNVPAIEEGFQAYLKKTISIRDANAKKEMKENFYHGILLGLFGNMDDWEVKSNAEAGEGYSGIMVEIEEWEIGIAIELKYAKNARFEEACQKALQQIMDRNYEEYLVNDGMKTIYRYGIACCKKRCRVISG